MSDIQKFDPSKLMEGVRDRIKAMFVSLIPDLQWEQLCKTEIDNFFDLKKDRRSYSTNDTRLTDFQYECIQILKELTHAKLVEALTEYTSMTWENNGPIISDTLKEILISVAPEVFSSMIGSKIQNVINTLRNTGY